MAASEHTHKSALRLLKELPGIADVVWAMVTQLASTRAPTSVLFTAAEKRAGTTVLASATAIGLAQHQRVPVCLVETNVRRPALAGYMGLARPGLSDVLDGRAELEDCLQQPRDCPGLIVLTAGTERAPVPGEFTTDRMTSILARLEQRSHYLVLDAAPVLDHIESRLLLRHADAVLLVLRARATRLSDAERAYDILAASGTHVLGSILNAFRAEGFSSGKRRPQRSFRRAEPAEPHQPSLVPSALRGESVRLAIEAALAVREALGSAAYAAPLPTNGGLGGAALAPPAARSEIATNGAALFANGGPAYTVLERPDAGSQGAANGAPLSSNGGPGGAALAPADARSEAAHGLQVEILERRIVKLNQLLEETTADLRRIAAMKNIDLGITSMYRSVQGLSSEEDAQAFKRSLMQEIFQANLELKVAMNAKLG